MASEEGVIKFNCILTQAEVLSEADIAELKHFRQVLYMQNLIGKDENGIGFGNISCRFKNSEKFIITASQTGVLKQPELKHFTLVDDADIPNNTVYCSGILQASSETLTHAAIYKTLPGVNAVVHVHHFNFWKQNLDKLPTTKTDVDYGSPQMAEEVIQLVKKLPVNEKTPAHIFVMAGHEAGIISYGTDLREATKGLILEINSLRNTI